jgi:hypothetical protein
MIDREPWNNINEGTLARTWEKRLRPKTAPRPNPRTWRKTVLWISSLWVAGMVASVLAVHVMVMGYQVDNLQTQFSQLTREQQTLSLTVTTLSSPRSLAQDAQHMHLTMVTPKVIASNRVPALQTVSAHATWTQLVSQWIGDLHGAVTKS